MIECTDVKIDTLDDYDELCTHITNQLYISETLIQELKDRIGTRCKKIIVEFPYRDFDFSSIYCSFYSKKHKSIPKECYRLHFFKYDDLTDESYSGFMVLRPSPIGDSRGRSHICPTLFSDKKKSYIMLAKSVSHILGRRYEVRAFPWMAQETDISRCAHSAAWSVVRYFSEKYSHYKQRSINDIVEMAPLYVNRKTPSEGLTVVQLSEIFSAAGFHPLILRKGTTAQSKERFLSSLFSYIESGIPVVAAISKREHAISIVGHGAINKRRVSKHHGNSLTLSHVFIDSLIGIDDNNLPYKSIPRKGTKSSEYDIDDISLALIPLYEKMFLPADIVIKNAKILLESKVLNIVPNPILRPYITSSRSLKFKTSSDESMNYDLKEILLKTPMPQFVWCVDISTASEYSKNKISARIIIDVTAATDDIDPWILMHDAESVRYYDASENQWLIEDLHIEPYQMYENNLREVYNEDGGSSE